MNLLWHGSGSGADDGVLRAIVREGIRKEFCHPDKNMQAQGVFFTASKPWALAYAERLQDPRHLYRRAGKPFVVAAAFAPTDDWDLDYELSHMPALRFLKRFDLEKFPGGKLRVTVRKKNVPMHFPNPPPAERETVVADWLLTSITPKETGPELNFVNLLNTAATPKIILGWNGDISGAPPKSGSLACVMEQLAHHYRDQNPAAFRDFIATQPEDDLALKYTGAAPLPVVAAEIKNGNAWEEFRA